MSLQTSAQMTKTHVAQGDVEGVEENGFAHYKGIPFAQPPVGELRWKAPVPAAQWNGVYQANTFKARPYQEMNGPARPGDPGVSEDCLYLNVLTPAKSTSEKLPVLVWIHGGGFNTGQSWDQSGVNFAKAGIVYCSITYRTNVFGFLSLPSLSAESQKENGRAISGNYGLMDQILALQWVHDNIAAFGGDPGKVTIMGESAGAISVSMLCQSPLAKGLFRGAISQSGGNMTSVSDQRIDNNTMRTLQGSEAYGTALLERLGLGKKKLKEAYRTGDTGYVLREAIAQVEAGQGSSAIGALKKIVDDYRMLKWDRPAARYLALAYLATGDAKKAYDVCQGVIGDDKSAAYSGEMAPAYWKALLKLGKRTELDTLVKKAISQGDRKSSAAAFTMRGDMIVADTNGSGDGLEQALRDGDMRVVLMYNDSECASERAEAMAKAADCFDKRGQAGRAEKLRSQAKAM